MSPTISMAEGLKLFARDLAEDTKAFVRQEIAKATAPLQAEIDDLKARRGLKYCGPWEPGTIYSTGDVTSLSGMWVCLTQTRTRPGESRDWQLAVRAGKDGKDLR